MSSRAETRRAKPTPADLVAADKLKSLWEAAIARARAEGHKLTQDVAAEALGVNQSAVSQYINGLIPLNYRALLIFAELIGVDPTEIRADLEEQQLGRHVGDRRADYGDWDDITGYAQAVGLGNGAEAQEYAETHKLKFRTESLRKKGLRPSALAVYYGHGDSMEPRIKSGDAVLFDTSDTRPVDGAVYLVQTGGEIHAKRCEIIEDTVYFRSDNPSGDHGWRKPRRMDNARTPITIVGRVRWIGSWED